MTADVEQALAAMRDLLEGQIADLEASGKNSPGISFGKRIGEGTAIAVERLNQIAAHKKLVGQHRAVVRGQAKLADGTYGRCDVCEALITPARLEALPWANHCVECAAVTAQATDDDGPAENATTSRRRGPAEVSSESPWSAVLDPPPSTA